MAIKADNLAGNKGKGKANEETPKAAPARVSENDQNRAGVIADISADQEYGQNSDSIEVVATLGDPTSTDTATIDIKKDDGTTERRKDVKPRTVGYKLRNVSDKPVQYAEYGLTEDFKHGDRLNHNDEHVIKTIAPGETAQLTIYEAAVLIASPEYNARFTGGDIKVSANFSAGRDKDGLDSAKETTAHVRFQVIDTPGVSIRDLPAEEILTFEKTDNNGRTVYKNRQIKPGYEKFAPVAARKRKQATSTRSSSASKANVRSTAAEQFFQAAQKAAKNS